jgi:hypothetical protein
VAEENHEISQEGLDLNWDLVNMNQKYLTTRRLNFGSVRNSWNLNVKSFPPALQVGVSGWKGTGREARTRRAGGEN